MKSRILLAVILLVTVACNKSRPYDDVDPETLKPSGSEDTRPSYSFEGEIADDRCRFVSEQLSLHYDDAGIIFSSEKSTGTTIYRAIGLATGNSAELFMNETDEPRLLVNGTEIKIKSAIKEHENEKGAWIHIQTPDYKHIVFVVTDL